MTLKKTWQKTNGLLHHRNKQKKHFSEWRRIINHDLKAVVNKFNNYFVDVANDLLKDMGEKNNQYQDYLKNRKEHF